jgi:hypothetical protein
MKRQTITLPLGLLRTKSLVQRPTRVRVQIVAHQPDLERLGVIRVQQLFDAPSPFHLATLRGHPHMPPTTQRLKEHEEIARPFTLVFAVYPPDLPGSGFDRLPNLAYQLFAGFVHADLGITWIIGQFVDLQHIFHAPHELGIGVGRNAPHLHQMRLQFVFLSV